MDDVPQNYWQLGRKHGWKVAVAVGFMHVISGPVYYWRRFKWWVTGELHEPADDPNEQDGEPEDHQEKDESH